MSHDDSRTPGTSRNRFRRPGAALLLCLMLISPFAASAQDAPEPTVEASVNPDDAGPGDAVTITVDLSFDRDELLELEGGDVVTYVTTLTLPDGLDAESAACATGVATVTCEVDVVDDSTIAISGEAPALLAGPGVSLEVQIDVSDDVDEDELDITSCTVVGLAASATPSAIGAASPVAGAPCEGAETEITIPVVIPAPTQEPTETPTPEPTETPTPEPTETSTPEPTETPTPEPTNTSTPEPTETPTPEPTNTPTPEPTETPTPEPTETPTPEPTETPTPEPTATSTPEPTNTPTPEPTETPTPEPTETPTPEPTETPTPEPTNTPTPEPTETPTSEPIIPTVEAIVSKPAPVAGETVDVTLNVDIESTDRQVITTAESVPFTITLDVPDDVTVDSATCALDEDGSDVACDTNTTNESMVVITGEIPASASSLDTQVSIALTVDENVPESNLTLTACSSVGEADAGTPVAAATPATQSCEGTETAIQFQVVEPVPTETPTLEPTNTPVPTETPTPEPTDTPTPEPTNTPTPVPTNTPEPTETPTPELTNTPTPGSLAGYGSSSFATDVAEANETPIVLPSTGQGANETSDDSIGWLLASGMALALIAIGFGVAFRPVSYTHLRAHETVLD